MKIAVTGGLGSGKSTVCKMLAAKLETELVDTDQLCRRQMLPGSEAFKEFCRVFGQRFIQGDGTLDRLLLKQAIFKDGELRRKLENILHPIVKKQVAALSEECRVRRKILLVEVPLLYEVGWQNEFDSCVVVSVPEKICIQRVLTRDGMVVDQVNKILNAQLPIKKKLEYADFIVDNSGTFVSTVQQIAWLSRQFFRKNC